MLARVALGIASATPLVGLVTSGDFAKRGLDVFLDSAARIADARPEVRFLVVGSKELPEEARTHPLVRRGVVAVGPSDEESRNAVVNAVRADAAMLAGVDPMSVVQRSIDEIVWTDGSLGCPQPGVMVTQALVPGWRIRLQAGRRDLDYHASRRGHWLLCPNAPAAAPSARPLAR